ncbi:hypothetical protein ACE418_02350 [Megasphaera sp. WILCCON 0056]|uniref:hypothetical protein n=1 Tax=Megasphaera sp. WILCCON 0056 TaxID=3345340 RepID=UPI003A7F8C39
MPAWVIIFLFLLLTGIAKLYMWLGVTDPLKAIIAATLTTFVIVCILRRSGQKQAEKKAQEKAAALEAEKAKIPHQLDAKDAAFLSAVGTGLILHELHERNKEQERAERDYDGNWENPDDDSQYDDNQYDDNQYDDWE